MSTGDAPQPDLAAYEIAGFGDRAFSRIIDAFIMICFQMVVMTFAWPLVDVLDSTGFLLDSNHATLGDHLAAYFGALLIVWALASVPVGFYEVVCTSRRGYSIGKGPTVQVIRWNEYIDPTGIDKYPSLFDSFLRWAFPHIALLLAVPTLGLSLILFIPVWIFVYSTALFSKNRRGWHDQIAGTVVVKAPRMDPPVRRVVARGAPLDEVDRWDVKASTAIVAFVSKLTGRSKTNPESPKPRGEREDTDHS